MGRVKSLILRIIRKVLNYIIPKNSASKTFEGEFFDDYLLNLNLRKLLWCYRKGFVPKEYFVYNLASNDYRKYLPRRNSIIKASINGDFSHLMGNKISFERHIRSVISGIDGLDVIGNIAYIDDGYLRSLNSRRILSGDYNTLINLLEVTDLILKPVSGSRGRGVFLIEKQNEKYLVNERKYSRDELVSLLASLKDYLVQEKFVQTGISHEIYPHSLNTMRICTMIDPDTNEPFIAYAIHRFGSAESGYTDNFSQGGITSLIGKDGRLSRGMAVDKDGKIQVYDFHPLSNHPIAGVVIPGWEKKTESLVEMMKRMPYLKHIGWDIVLSGDRLYFLEGNIGPGVNLIQIHQPLQEISQAWNFYKYYQFV